METVGEGTNPGETIYTPPRTTVTSPCHGGRNDINSPAHFGQSMAQRILRDKCFKCGNQGHWAKNCPQKTPKKASSQSSNSEEDIQFLPVMRCECGVAYGISNDPGRKRYYSTCNCADVETNNPNRRVLWCSETKAPLCECGAGRCTINMRKDENGEPFTYYTCRIRAGHGSCSFLHFVTAPSSPILTTVRRCIEKDRQPSVLNNGTPNTITHESECSDFSNRNIDTLEVETCDPVRGKQLSVSRLMSRSDIHLLQIKFWKQISDADDSGDESEVQNLSHRVDGWMGRLAFPPSRFLADPPPKHLFCLGEISQNTASGDNQLLTALSRTSSLKRSFMQEEVTSLFAKKVGNKLQKGLSIQSLDAPDHDIQLTSSAAQIQLMVHDNCNTQTPAEHSNIEKYVDEITSFGAKALTSLTASKNNLLSARQRMSHFKDKLLQIEQQLNRCQTENSKLETLLQDIFKDVGPSNQRMHAAYQVLTEEDECMLRTTIKEICSNPSEIYEFDLRKRQKIVGDHGQ